MMIQSKKYYIYSQIYIVIIFFKINLILYTILPSIENNSIIQIIAQTNKLVDRIKNTNITNILEYKS
jgi:hypothetical protein